MTMLTGLFLPPPPPGPPQRKRWTCAEYHAMGDRGEFEGRRTFLIDGEIYEMAPGDAPHECSTLLGRHWLERAFGPGFHVRTKAPLVLGQSTDPEPDLAVVAGEIRDFSSVQPTTAILVIEISDTTRHYDLNDKASLYAAGRIPEYWVVDVQKRKVVVHCDPQLDATKRFGYGYATVTVHSPDDEVKPLAATQAVRVCELLP